MNNFGKFSYLHFKKLDKNISKPKETVEEFIARGGQINKINNATEMPKRLQEDKQLGVNIPTSKLNEKQVLEIRKATGTNEEIGKRFGVNGSTVSKIKNRVSWTHIKE